MFFAREKDGTNQSSSRKEKLKEGKQSRLIFLTKEDETEREQRARSTLANSNPSLLESHLLPSTP